MYNYDELSKILHAELDVTLERMKKAGLPAGIIDLKVCNVSCDDVDVATTYTFLTEVVEMRGGTWDIEGIHDFKEVQETLTEE